MMKDYYQILDISPDATPAEIRSAYRRQARDCHPDCSDEDGQRFRELQEAYEALTDPARRRRYDRRRQPASAVRAGAGPGPLFDLLRAHFAGEGAAPRPSGTDTLQLRVRITPEEARSGGQIHLRLAVPRPCPRCRGTGGMGFYRCARCGGAGLLRAQVPLLLEFPPGMRDGQRVRVNLARAGLDSLSLSLTFVLAE